jgi:hypothetical protein
MADCKHPVQDIPKSYHSLQVTIFLYIFHLIGRQFLYSGRNPRLQLVIAVHAKHALDPGLTGDLFGQKMTMAKHCACRRDMVDCHCQSIMICGGIEMRHFHSPLHL